MDGVTTEYDDETKTWVLTYENGPVEVTVALSVDEAVEMARTILDRTPDE